MNRLILPPLCVLVATGTLFLATILNVPDSAPESGQPAGSGIAVLTQRLVAAEPSAPKFESSPVSDEPEFARSQDETARDVPQERPAAGKSVEDTSEEPGAETGSQLHTTIGSVEIFPASNDWNQRIDDLPVHRHSSVWLRSIGIDKGLHPDFGTVWRGAPNGIPYVVVRPDQPKVPVAFQYADESDPGPYPIPPNPPIEGGPNAPLDSDRHVIMVDPQSKRLYELFRDPRDPIVGWRAVRERSSIWSRNHYRPLRLTSALDAAGLPDLSRPSGPLRRSRGGRDSSRAAVYGGENSARLHFPGTALCQPIERSEPAADGAASATEGGLRHFKVPAECPRSLTALKRYGMLLADNGSDWFISGAPNPRWSDSELATLKQIKGRDLECVHTGELTR